MINQFAKTKILATIGPATDSEEMLAKLIDAGVDGFRFNFSHGSYDYYDTLFERVHSVRKKLSKPIPILVDLQGPKIRVGELKESEYNLTHGQNVRITTRNIHGDDKLFSTSYKNLISEAEIGNSILIDDGLVRLNVTSKEKNALVCVVDKAGKLKPRKGINLPGMKLKIPALTEKDFDDLKYSLDKGIDFIALSFVREANDILQLKNYLSKNDFSKPVIAKIEKSEAVQNFDEILNAADGIMIARGDLGVELPAQDVPVIQKQIIKKCNQVGKMVITATQMFESMVKNPVPTRAEASDVANAVWDGTDVVMLSAETSVGNYPIEAVEIMNNILVKTESQTEFKTKVNYQIPADLSDNLFDSLGQAVANVSDQVKAAVIVVFTHHGRKARVISKFKPSVPIIAISNNFEVLNNLNLYRSVIPIFMEKFAEEDYTISDAEKIIKENNLVKKNDIVLFTSGAPFTDKGRKNWMRFKIIE